MAQAKEEFLIYVPEELGGVDELIHNLSNNQSDLIEVESDKLIDMFETIRAANDTQTTKTLDKKILRKEAIKMNSDRFLPVEAIGAGGVLVNVLYLNPEILTNALSFQPETLTSYMLLFNLITGVTLLALTIMAYKGVKQSYNLLIDKYEDRVV